MADRQVVICSPVRTAIGTYGGTLKDAPATDLGAVVIRATLERAKLPPGDVDTVVMGNVIQAGNKMNPARQAAIHGGVPVEVPAMTVNRVCGSGAQAIASAAQEIMLGFIDCAIAGGMENMDRAPYLMGGGRWGYRMGDAADLRQHAARRPERCVLRSAFRMAHRGSGQLAPDHPRRAGPLGGALAEAFRGRAGRRQVCERNRAGRDVRARTSPGLFDKDEHNRPDTTLESLAKLRAGVPQGRHDHGRQCAGPQQRRGGDDRRRAQTGPRRTASRRWRASSPTASARSSPACSDWVRCRR